ncbi:MAG: hypothetical protein ACE5FN_04000 [Leptospirillia bacterium]
MKAFGAMLLALVVFGSVWFPVAGGIAVTAGLLVEGDMARHLATAGWSLAPLLGGALAVYVIGRVFREFSTGYLFGLFAATVVGLAVLFTTPFYLGDGPEHGTMAALQGVIATVFLSIVGSYGGKLWASHYRDAVAAAGADTPGS